MVDRSMPTRERLVVAMGELLRRQGYGATTVKQLTEAAGATMGSLYHHFPGGKAELVSECVRTGLDGVLEAISPADPRTEQPQEGFQPDAWLVGALEQLAASPRLARLLLITWAEAAVDPAVAELLGTHQETLRSAIDRVFADWAVAELGLTEASARQWVEMFSQAVLSVLQGWVVQSALLPGFDHEAYLDYARTLVASDEG